MDGTLVDTEKVWEVALHELAARYGAVLSSAARRAMVGASSATTMRLLARGPRPALTALDAWRVRPGSTPGSRSCSPTGVLWRPGARN